MRLRAYMDLGIEDIWVSVVNPKDDNQMLAYALSDNDRAGITTMTCSLTYQVHTLILSGRLRS